MTTVKIYGKGQEFEAGISDFFFLMNQNKEETFDFRVFWFGRK